MVQVLLPGVWILAGLQTMVRLTGLAWRVMVAALLVPAEAAVKVGVWAALTACVPTANAALVAPAATVTWLGGVRVEVLLDMATGVPPAGAAAVSVTAQLTVPPPTTVVGLQTSDAIPGCAAGPALKVSAKVLDVPFHVAVNGADEFALTAAAALAVNVAVDIPGAIITDDGTVTAGLPLDRLTLAALVAVPARLTVQVEVPGGVNVPGVQLRLASRGATALSVKVAVLDVPFQVAVTSAETFALTAAAALAVKTAVDFPAEIVTDEGTVTAVLPLDRFTLVALVATFDRATVQVELPGAVNVSGVHVRLPSTTGAGALRVRVAVLDAPFQVAVSSAEAFAVTADEALAVNVALDFAAGIVTDDGTVTAALPLDRLTLVIPVATFVRATMQVELPGGVKVAGMHVRLPSTGGAGALSARVAVFAVPFKVAVSSAEPFALTAAAALAVNVALDVPVPIVSDAGTVTAALPLDRLTLTGLIAKAVKLTVQVEVPGGVNVFGVQLRLESTGAGALSVRVAVLDVPFQVAVSSAEPFTLTAAAALAANVALDVPVPIVTDAGTVTAAFPLERLTLAGLVAAMLRLTVQMEVPGGVNVLGAHVRLESTGTGAASSVRVAVFELPVSDAVKSTGLLALTPAGALAVNVALVSPAPIVTDDGTTTAGLPLDKLTLTELVAGLIRLTVHVELPGGVNVLGVHVRLERTRAGGFRVRVAVCEFPFNVPVKTAEAVALTAAAALAMNVVLLDPAPMVTEAGTVTAPFPLDSPTTMLLVAAPLRLTVQVEVPGGVSVLGEHARPESVGADCG